jgi:nicotinamidase-related amidase
MQEGTEMTKFANAALLSIDMQQAFDKDPWPKSWNTHVDRNALSVLAAWRAAGLPVIHARHDSAIDGSTLAAGHDGNRFRPGFEPLNGEPLVVKSVNSAFIGTDLDLRLRRLGVSKLYSFGISTDMCVSTTVRMGANMGYQIVLVEDACNCFELPDRNGNIIAAKTIHDANVATLEMEFCKVVSAAELVLELG